MAITCNLYKKLDGFILQTGLQVDDAPLALLGASGSGKSMTLRCIAGIERPDHGKIVVDGTVLFDSAAGVNLPPQKRRVGLLFQNYALFPTMTVRQNIACGARRTGNPGQVETLMERFGLEKLGNRLPDELSGGQQQRVALARILASDPHILMLDEPFSALDTTMRWNMEQLIAEVIAHFSGTAILVSHNREEAYRLCERVAVIDRGIARTVREKHDLFAHPRTRAEAALVGVENVAEAVRVGPYQLKIPAWGLTLETAVPVPSTLCGVGIRARMLRRAEAHTVNCFHAAVARVLSGPESQCVLLQTKSGNDCIHWDCVRDAKDFQIGQELSCMIAAEDIHMLIA